MKLRIFVQLLSCFIVANLYSSEGLLSTFESGAGIHYMMNSYSGAFTKLGEIPNCCPKFNDGEGTGYMPFFFYKLPLFDKFSIEARLAFSTFNSEFLSLEKTKVNVDDKAVDGEFSHLLQSDFTKIGFQPMVSYEALDYLNLNVGLDIGYLMSASFYQIDSITKPADRGTFLDKDGNDTKKRTQFEYTGSIPDLVNIQMGLLFGASYDLPLNSGKTLWVAPELFYSIGLTEISKGTSWKTNTLYVGASFKYAPNKFKAGPGEESIMGPDLIAKELEISGNLSDIYFGEFKIPEPVEVKPKILLEANVEAVGLQEGQEFKEATMVVEEFLSTNMRPLLNYIFFDNNSSKLPDRYNILAPKQTEKFKNDNLCNVTTLPTYYNILNIMGLRLRDNPGTSLNLTGCNSGTGGENSALSGQRANSVKDYLIQVWGIAPNRVLTFSRDLPEKPSNKLDKDGIEENKRVELKSDSWEVMKPVVTEDTLRKVSPPVIRFYTNTKAENKIASWKLTVLQNGEVLKVVTGIDSVPQKIDWQIDREKESIPKFSEAIEYIVEIIDNRGNKSYSNTGLLPTEMITIQKKKDNRVGDKRIDRYSLILFDYASTELSGANSKIIDFIKGSLQSDSRLLISGFTDRMGDETFNFTLSKERAEKTAQALLKPTSFTRGVGESMLIYDNDLPEGRFYCRTVEIEVETPISWNK